jgi:LacI family transcriptional regulator, galactose operon repressor
MRLDLIADRAGVSMATVSRVLNNKPNVSVDTRQRVLDVMRELSPLKVSSLVIGLVIPDHNNQFFTDTAFQFQQECDRRNTVLLVASSDGRADRELDIISRFITYSVDGIIFISAGTGQSKALLSTFAQEDMPPVLSFDRGVENYDRVAGDSRNGTQQAVDHLVSYGHKTIGYIKGIEGTETAAERFESFEAAMDMAGLKIRKEWVFSGDYQPKGGRDCAEALLSMDAIERPTAILSANDLMAIALMQRLSEAGWCLPRDLSVIGFDGIPAASWVHPRLVTIAQKVSQLVPEALNLLLSRIAQRSSDAPVIPEPKLIIIKPELQTGKSVDKPFNVKSDLRVIHGAK